MKRSLLPFLVCSECQQFYTLENVTESEGEEVLTAELRCPCKTFPVLRGIPRFVESEHYAANFGYEWTRFNTTQLDSNTGLKQSENTFIQKTGWTLNSFTPADTVLDVGCGPGRFIEVIAGSAATIIGIDLSQAVESAYQNIGRRANVHIIQADVFKLPFCAETFSRIYSIGVLHHTPSTEKAFYNLPKLLKPEGQLAIWVYRKPPFGLKSLTHLFRLWTKKMSYTELIRFCQALDRYWYPLVRIFRIGKVYPLRLLLFTSVFPMKEWRILNNFDAYSPPYNHQHTKKEVSGWFANSGLTDIQLLDVDSAVRGAKPARIKPQPN